MKAPNTTNTHDTREAWLRAAANELRSYFERRGYELPEKIRYAIAFTSTGRKSKRVGECWHSAASDDASYEIFIRADLADPVKVLGVLVKELIHTVLPNDAGHGKLFKTGCDKHRTGRPDAQSATGRVVARRISSACSVSRSPPPRQPACRSNPTHGYWRRAGSAEEAAHAPTQGALRCCGVHVSCSRCGQAG